VLSQGISSSTSMWARVQSTQCGVWEEGRSFLGSGVEAAGAGCTAAVPADAADPVKDTAVHALAKPNNLLMLLPSAAGGHA
jgi:hypothetical protein